VDKHICQDPWYYTQITIDDDGADSHDDFDFTSLVLSMPDQDLSHDPEELDAIT
jgi:hypothetical protein